MHSVFFRRWLVVRRVLRSNVLRTSALLTGVGIFGIVVGARYLTDGTSRESLMRWHSLQAPADSNEIGRPHLAVYSVPDIKPARALPTLRDLSDSAQARAIEVIQRASADSHPWDDVRRALSASPEPGEKDPYLFERVLVATVSKDSEWLPGDRMVRMEIRVEPRNFEFASYTIAATDTETVKVSSVEATEVRKLPSDIDLAFPGLGEVKASGLPGQERTVKTTADINSQYEQLGIDITPVELHIIRESSVGGDVVGNTRIALSMITDALMIMNGAKREAVKPKEEIVLAVTGLNLEAQPPTMDVVPLVPLPHCALQATISASYNQRHIVRGREFYDEALHDVRFVSGDILPEQGGTIAIAGADDVSPFVWTIQLVPPNEQPNNQWHNGEWHALSAMAEVNGALRRIVFSDYGRAVKVAHWVRTHALDTLASTPTGSPTEKAGLYTFNYRDKSNYGLAVIKRTGDSCRERILEPASEEPVAAK
jgi:hypothetical protein